MRRGQGIDTKKPGSAAPARRTPVGGKDRRKRGRNPAMEPNDLPIVCIPLELPAEAAAELLEFLTHLTETIERHYFGELHRLPHPRTPHNPDPPSPPLPPPASPPPLPPQPSPYTP